MGVRYLWVDSLCIVQDSTSSWELNAKAMHLVYGNAYFTICAADGDATKGLRAVNSILSRVRSYGTRKDVSAQSQSAASSYHTAMDTTVGFPIEDDEKSEPLVIQHPVPLLVSRSPENVIQGSPWDKRGWTFQERLLSRRCLIFAEGLIYFQCRSTVMSQDKHSDSSQRGWSQDCADSPLRTLGELKERAFWFYMKCVGLYSGRQLTKPKDILTAFQGSSWLLEQYLRAPLLYGLPRSHFDLALLWTPVTTLCRRKKRVTGTLPSDQSSSDQGSSTDADFGDTEFPSWSWCGWMDGKCEYEIDKTKMLGGCISHVQDWLTNHTWIQWYIRDREGNLRPLWDRWTLEEDISGDICWRGYPGRETPPRYPIRRFVPPQGNKARLLYLKSHPEAPSDESYYPESIDSGTARRRPQDTSARDRGRPEDIYRSEPSNRQDWERRRSTEHYVGEPRQQYYSGVTGAEGSESGTSLTQRRGEPRRSRDNDSQRLRQRLHHRGPQNDTGTSGTDHFAHRSQPPPRPAPTPPPASLSLDSETDRRVYGRRRARTEVSMGDQMLWKKGFFRTSTQETSTYDTPDVDIYGRPIKRDAECGTNFNQVLPDNPFGVHCGPFTTTSGFADAETMPVLQFSTWQKDLGVSIQNPQSSTQNDNVLCQCDILDDLNLHCGLIKLPRSYIKDHVNEKHFFVALADAKEFTEEEFEWNNYINTSMEDSKWDLYFVLLLERNEERAVWERVGLGRVFKAAFKDSDWKEITLG